jgi:hypothetical protein
MNESGFQRLKFEPVTLVNSKEYCLLGVTPGNDRTLMTKAAFLGNVIHLPNVTVSYSICHLFLFMVTSSDPILIIRYRSRGPGFDSRRFQIFWEAVGLERGPLSLVRTTVELLGRNSSGSGQENPNYDRGDPLRWPRNTLYPQKLALLRQQAAVGRHSSLADQSHGV